MEQKSDRKSDFKFRLKEWHDSLETQRADRAALRRCDSPEVILRCPAFHSSFYNKLKLAFFRKDFTDEDWLGWATIAGIGAHIRVDNKQFYAPAQWGEKKNKNSSPKLSELRLQRLIQASNSENWYEFYRLLKQALSIIQYETNFTRLSEDILCLVKQRKENLNNFSKIVSFKWLQAYYKEHSTAD